MALCSARWLLPTALVLTQLPARAADDWRARWRAALALYEQAKYDKACPLLRNVSKEQPKNAAVWTDLGACEHQRKGTWNAAALHALRMSIRWGDESTRTKGYRALGETAVRLALPADRCTALPAPAEAGCSRKVFACTRSWNMDRSDPATSGVVAFLAYTEAHAEAQANQFDPRMEGAFSDVLVLNNHTDPGPSGPECRVIYADACQGNVGVVCTRQYPDGTEQSDATEWGIPDPD
ncbi:MAG TPA: hypothetical protein VER12_16860 [Polyangiaceae bacterium]|nr:hypothetical protein [Polyangiaceae bacterium]